MRIALVHYTKPPVVGGVERVIADQAAALAGLGHEVEIVDFEGMAELERAVECRRVVGSPYLNPSRVINKHRHGLPHWHQDSTFCFITWRLADSLPAELVRNWNTDREIWEKAHPKPWTNEEAKEFQARFGDRLEEWLDQGAGRCLLAETICATEVEMALHFFNGQRYQLHSYVVMPNHVHVLVRLFDGFPVQKIVQNWKERSAKAINAALRQTGTVWMPGYFDRLIRSDDHFRFVSGYIASNPASAKLKAGFALWNADDSSALQKPDAILVHNIFTMPFNLEWTAQLHRIAATHPEIRWMNWVHDVAAVNPHYAHLDWSAPEFQRLCTPPPNAIHIAISEARRQDYARSTGLDAAKVHVIPNGIDPARVLALSHRITAAAEEGNWWESDVILVHPARILRRKNLEMGIHVTAQLKALGISARYAITGAPDPHQADGAAYFAELQAMIAALGVDDEVQFLAKDGGPLSEEDVRSLYAIGDALFFPSTGEGFGLPLLEAALHRLPIWCSDLPVHHEVLGDAASFFPANGDPAALAASLQNWIQSDAPSRLRRNVWQGSSWPRLCKERLEPLLTSAIETL